MVWGWATVWGPGNGWGRAREAPDLRFGVGPREAPDLPREEGWQGRVEA